MGEKYILTMDKETALMVDRACEFYSRMIMGQFMEAADQVFDAWPEKFKSEHFCDMRNRAESYLVSAKIALFPELHPGAYYGVGRSRRSDTTWNVHQVIRYAIAWHDHPDGGNSVDFGKPMHFSDAPMPEFVIQLDMLHSTGEKMTTEEIIK